MTPNGAAIRAIREAQRSSLRELAEAAGINASYLSQIERGQRDPRPEITQRIADALGVHLHAITQRGPTVQTDDEDLRLYTPEQVADLWGVSKSWLQKRAAAREIECTYLRLPGRSKGLLRFSRAQVQQIITGFTVDPATRGRRPAKSRAAA